MPSFFLLLPIVQGVLGALGASGVLGQDWSHWFLMAAGLPLTVQVPVAAHLLAKNTEKTNVALRTLAKLPLADMHVDSTTRLQVYAFAEMPEPPPVTTAPRPPGGRFPREGGRP